MQAVDFDVELTWAQMVDSDTAVCCVQLAVVAQCCQADAGQVDIFPTVLPAC